MMFLTLLGTIEAGLKLWQSKEKRKYADKCIQLKRDWYEEWNKPEDKRSDARLDNLMFELRLVAIGFAADVGSENPANQ